jgi:hypothetical protein
MSGNYSGLWLYCRQSHFPLAAPAQRALTKLEAVMPVEFLEEARAIAGRVNWELKTSAVSKNTLNQFREALAVDALANCHRWRSFFYVFLSVGRKTAVINPEFPRNYT